MQKRFWICLTVSAAAAVGLFAQSDRGTITGSVTDSSAAAIANAEVTATHVATNTSYKSATTTSGNFTLPSLPVGVYQIKIENAGFKTYVQDGLTIAGGREVNVAAQLELGATQQTIEVSANAQLLEVGSARVATQVSNSLVDGLPVVVSGSTRSPYDLAGVAAETSSGTNFRVGGGGASNSYGMTLDGNSIANTMTTADSQTMTQINTPSVEALTEFNVEAGGFKAETGHASGGTVSFISKSGTNALHGSAYEFLRNEALDARGFFPAKKAVYKQHDFGFTVGGPVVIPKLYDGHNKTFFFFSYEGFRNRAGADATAYSVPPPEFYAGDLRNWVDQSNRMIQIYDPATQQLVNGAYVRQPFPNNQIPQSMIDPVAKPMMQYVSSLVKPNVAAVPGTSAYVRNNYISSGTSIQPLDKLSFKVDQTLSVKHHASFLYAWNKQTSTFGPNGAPGLPKPLAGQPGFNKSSVYRGSWDYTVTPTLLNRFYGGFYTLGQYRGSMTTLTGSPFSEGLETTDEPWSKKGICIPNVPDCDVLFPITTFANSEFTQWNVNGPNGSDRVNFEVRDDMTKISGNHTFKWGYYYNDSHYNGLGDQNISGLVGFNRLNTSVPGVTNQATGGGSAFASFLLGQVYNYGIDTPRYIATQYRTHQMFFQDDWKVTSRLTLNLGIRYEINLAPVVGDDQLEDLDPDLPNPAAGGIKGALKFAGTGKGRTGSRTMIDHWYGGIGPRLGFAYTVNSKTSIRGSATRSFGPVIGLGSSAHNTGYIVRITSSDTSQGLNPLWQLKNGPPAWAKPPVIDPSVGNGASTSYYNGNVADRGAAELNYAFNVQRQLTGTSSLEVGYLGTLGSNLPSTLFALNQLPYRNLPSNLSPFSAAGRTALNSLVGSAAANAAGVVAPWAGFNSLWGTGATVAQSLRPFPQYGTIDTNLGGGDRIGHSTYHSLMVKFNKRYSAGLTVQASYVLAKALTDADGSVSIPIPGANSGNATTTTTPFDSYNRRLDKSIASWDQTHQVKGTFVYELPFGVGKKFLNSKGIASAALGGWRFSGIMQYTSGVPLPLLTTVSFPVFDSINRSTVTTYDGWRGSISGSEFDPAADRFLQPTTFFGTQPTDRFGNVTRYNPKQRDWPNFTENVSLARNVKLTEGVRMEFRAESFNLLNRTQFAALTGGTTLQNPNFGLWRAQANQPRRMQLALKLYW